MRLEASRSSGGGDRRRGGRRLGRGLERDVPTGPCMWVGDKPANMTLPDWKPILLTAADEFRPPPPPDCHSAEVNAETDAVRQFDRKWPNIYRAFYWQSPAGLQTSWYDHASRWMFEDKTDSNPPAPHDLRDGRGGLLRRVHRKERRDHSNGNPCSRSSTCSSAACRPSRIASMISGARRASRQDAADVGGCEPLLPAPSLPASRARPRPASSATGTPAPAQ